MGLRGRNEGLTVGEEVGWRSCEEVLEGDALAAHQQRMRMGIAGAKGGQTAQSPGPAAFHLNRPDLLALRDDIIHFLLAIAPIRHAPGRLGQVVEEMRAHRIFDYPTLPRFVAARLGKREA